MSLAPLLDAAPIIHVHAFSAIAAFALGIVQLAARERCPIAPRLIRLALMFVGILVILIHGFN